MFFGKNVTSCERKIIIVMVDALREEMSRMLPTTTDAIIARAERESWTPEDMYAAFLQSSLLSYRSSGNHAAHSRHYVNSAPEDYAHNCPWNDWVPPSHSRLLFLEAAERTRASCRVRVHLFMSPESLQRGDMRVIAFATVETNVEGKQALVLRRGAETLASLPIDVLRVHQISPENPRVMVLTIRGDINGHAICLCFENDKRVESFAAMLGRAS